LKKNILKAKCTEVKRPQIKTGAAHLLQILLVLLLLAALCVPAFAETPAEKLDRLKEDQKGIEANIDNAEKSKAEAQQTKQYYLALVNNLKAQMETISEDIAAQRQSITQKNAEVAEAAASVERQKYLFEQRMRSMYEMSRRSSLALLLGVENITQALRFTENLQSIAESDTKLLDALQKAEAELEHQRTELEQQLEALNARQQELNETSAVYAQAIQNADADINAAEAQEAASKAALAENQQQIEQAEKEWQEWVHAEQVDFSFGGVFDWPLPGYTTISSGFTDVRDVWNNGQTDVHRGIDIPAPAGTKIYAAADGVVSTTLHWSYGIAVKLSHGDGVVTVYGHMSARAVNDGDYVTKGQLIGYVGSTGNSRGNHLHFEVDINGQFVNPWLYLKGEN